jgi:integrase
MKTVEPIRNPKDVRKFLNYFKRHGQMRNHLLATIGIYTALRISDILNLSTNDVYDFGNDGKPTIRTHIRLVEQKSKKPKCIALNKKIIAALKAYIPEATPNTPLIINPNTGRAISRIQAYRIIRAAATAVGIRFNVSCHSLRKTFGYAAWKKGFSPVVLMGIYNHSAMVITQRYLGVAQDDFDAVYMAL